MIERLIAANEIDLLAVSYPLGGLVFESEPECQWFNRTFHMLKDILKDSWAYQELFREAFERGRKEGLEQRLQEALRKARQQELRRLRQILVDIVLERFPKIVPQAQKYIDMIDDPALLESLIVKISLTKRAKVVTKLLVSLSGDDEQH